MLNANLCSLFFICSKKIQKFNQNLITACLFLCIFKNHNQIIKTKQTTSNPYLANLPTSVATITTNPTVQTPTAHQLGQQQTPSLNTQQLVSQQIALQQLLAYSAYGQVAAGALASVPSLTDLQAYNLITTLPTHQSSNQGTAANLLNNQMHNNHTANNHLINTAALMRNYISPGTSVTQNTLKAHPNGNLMNTRQVIKLEVSKIIDLKNELY